MSSGVAMSAGAAMGSGIARAGRVPRVGRIAVDTRRRPGRVRLTRRGRAVLLLLLALALAGLAVVLAAPASQAADPAGPVPTVVTRSGDTLWSIATRYAPGVDPFATIDEIRRLNGISGYMVPVGVRLTLPRRR